MNGTLVIIISTLISTALAIWAILTRFKLKDTSEKYKVALKDVVKLQDSLAQCEGSAKAASSDNGLKINVLENKLINLQSENGELAEENKELKMEMRYARPQPQAPPPRYEEERAETLRAHNEYEAPRPRGRPKKEPMAFDYQEVKRPQPIPQPREVSTSGSQDFERDDEPMPRTSLQEQPKMELPEQLYASSDMERALDMRINKLPCKSCGNTYWKKSGLVSVQGNIISQKFDCGICGESITLKMPRE